MSPSPWIALKALSQLGFQPVLFNALYRLGLVTGHYRRGEKREENREKRLGNREQGIRNKLLRPLFALPRREELLAVLREAGRTALLAEADEIVAGKVHLFGGEPVDLQLTIPGKLEHWTAYETGKADLRHLTLDIKWIWEPARFGWAFTLGRAYYLTRDEKYAESFWHNFETFRFANPPYFGPNWTSGQEAALRLMVFVWAAQIFLDSSSSTPERKAALAGSVALHALRIPPTLIYARSQQNNHLLTEAAGLLTAGLALPDHPKASRWRMLGWKFLNKGLQSQIDSSGEYAQHSTNYHRLMLQLILWTDALIRSNDFSRSGSNDLSHLSSKDFNRLGSNDLSRYYWPAQTREAILRSIRWLLSNLDPDSGRAPNLGANDGAYIFTLTVCPFSDFRPAAHAAVRAFLRDDLPRGPWDEMAIWFGIPLQNREHVPAPSQPGDQVYGKDSWASLRTAQFTSRPSHADQLHVDLWWRALNVARDAGTYRYTADPPWDNSLTTALVHNTVTIDGRDQFRRAGRFLYLDWFNAYRGDTFEADPTILQRICGWHEGYRKLGIRHERTLTVFKDGSWQIKDDLLRLGGSMSGTPRTLRLHWLLPDWEWEMQKIDQAITLRLASPHGPVILTIRLKGGEDIAVDLVRAGEAVHSSGLGSHRPPLQAVIRGWVSPTYGVKIPALSLAVETISLNDVQFISEFTFPR